MKNIKRNIQRINSSVIRSIYRHKQFMNKALELRAGTMKELHLFDVMQINKAALTNRLMILDSFISEQRKKHQEHLTNTHKKLSRLEVKLEEKKQYQAYLQDITYTPSKQEALNLLLSLENLKNA